MSRLGELLAGIVDAAQAAAAAVGWLGRAALIPATFAAAFVVRVERWYRLVPRAVEAIRSRIAEGGGHQ